MPEEKAVPWTGKISVLVQTYNRKEMLLRCLKAILAQVKPADEVIVLDNGSTDGTCEYLERSGFFEDAAIVLYRRPKSTGPAAGLDTLFRLGRERGSDWVWYLEDDLLADPDALKELKSAYAKNFSNPEEVGFLKSLVTSADGSPHGVPEVDLRAGLVQAENWAARLDSGLVKVRSGTFLAALIPRSTLMHIGNIYPDFVSYGEDTDCTARSTELPPIYLVGRSKVTHLNSGVGRWRSLPKRGPKIKDSASYYYKGNLYFRWYYYSFGRTLLCVFKRWYEAVQALGAESYPLRRIESMMQRLLSALIVAMRLKAGPLHFSVDQQPLSLQLRRRRVSAPHVRDG